MEKRLRSSLQTSAVEFLSAAVKLPFKSSKTAMKSLINTSIKPSSDLTSTLPFSLCNSISHSISQFKNLSDPTFTASPRTPPAKRVRRSARNIGDGAESSDGRHENERQPIVEKLQVYAYILRLCVFHPKNAFSVSDLFPAVQALHDNLILFESEAILLSEIANLCEDWWKGGLEGKERLISQSLPVILSRSLTLMKKVDVHRVYGVREAFTLFDFEDESIEDLKHLLIRCLISPLYLKTEEGRKFLAFLFCLSGQLTKELCAMIKSQIPFGRKSMLEAYGEIVFRAWKAVEGEGKHEIENGFLQGLFEGALYAGSPELATSIRRILWGFVNQRTTQGVEKLIFGLAEPMIFRSLQLKKLALVIMFHRLIGLALILRFLEGNESMNDAVAKIISDLALFCKAVANSNVRQNALHLLLDLFPLEDPDATKEVKDTLLEKQFFLLEKLLMDECPDVRGVAVEGCCRILHMFWEVIPSPTITKIITKISDDMARDSCTEVRLSTVNGVIYLLGNPQSHEVLKVILPRLGTLITDSASVVRAALADLLLLLNDLQNFQFHKVVHMDALLSVLADDQPVIARKITKLLIPSYFPSKATEEEACKRCITLIKRSPQAGARFCEFVATEGASLRSLMKLFSSLIGLALSSKLEVEYIEGLLTAASHLCTNLAKDSSFQAALKVMLSAKKLKTLFTVACTAHAQSSVCNIISTLSLDATGDLFEDCIGLITRCSGLSDNIEKQAEVRSAHKMILSCGWFEDMFETLIGLLQKTASGSQVCFGIELEQENGKPASRTRTRSSTKTSSKLKRGNKKKSSNTDKNTFLEDYAVAVGVAWQIKDLLLSENTREALLGSGILERAYLALKVIAEVTFLHCLEHDYLKTCPVSAYATLTLHMSLYKLQTVGVSSKASGTTLDLTLDHLLHCAYNVFKANNNKNSKKPPLESLSDSKMTPGCSKDAGESQSGTGLTKQTRISNMVKMLTVVSKFIVDAATMSLLPPQYQERCLNFTIEYLKFIMTNLREHSLSQLPVSEEYRKDIFICLKSSFTYGAKLLNLVLKTDEVPLSPEGPQCLVNELFNLFVSVEEFLGYGFATRLNSVVQPWIPDLILAMGSWTLLKEAPNGGPHAINNAIMVYLPTWYCVIAGIEIFKLREAGSDDETENVNHFPAFRRFMETTCKLLKANREVLDAVGVKFLNGALSAFGSKNFEVVFGLLRFVCVELVGIEGDWGGLRMMLACLGEIYAKLEMEAEVMDKSEGDGEKFSFGAKALIEPVWKTYIYDERKHAMEEE
ncbi:condensin-2 complex subunit G2 [Striga asiatica]|uniref:Condensin-2 complex subunit G2 n=1 Tax=Striga asiatica TaxID=4170 RepID=A0A5A7PEA3_STRAF|nr:condensin-2 complex subunit G2 [Striga asiatica]